MRCLWRIQDRTWVAFSTDLQAVPQVATRFDRTVRPASRYLNPIAPQEDTVHHASVEPAFVLQPTPGSARLAIGPPVDLYGDGDVWQLDIELSDEGLRAQTVAHVAIFDDPPLHVFLRTLADDWRGWHDMRTWQNHDRQVQIDVTHDGVQRITLAVTLRPQAAWDRLAWSARCMFSIEPGEQLRQLADDVAALLLP